LARCKSLGVQFRNELGGLFIIFGVGKEFRFLIAHRHDHTTASLRGVGLERLEQSDNVQGMITFIDHISCANEYSVPTVPLNLIGLLRALDDITPA
jgi:hypothetical protein